ncbi:hypothetical protein KGM_201032 [Danaus plexippus plexippus]|uniref:Kazal-like domain-containing protein n=1 Tax=Danaus plexippus plexippus TaxID=278856 RepID=A0A212FFL9_DANPL|nr:hypothetical protein KGM_201032 [Danaus plexippus plexippus]
MNFKLVSLLALMVVSCMSFPQKSFSPCACSKIYRPLCASDGRSYTNPCEFECRAKYYLAHFAKEIFFVKDVMCSFTNVAAE